MGTVHSEEHLIDSRFQWWNEDYLDLLAKRFELHKVRAVLDVGVGLGHWSRPILKRVSPDWTFCGLDMEVRWVEEAAQIFSSTFPDVPVDRILFKRGDAHHLPYPDCAFDLVTCQTLLIHTQDPLRVLQEMKRVLRPNGIVLCAEPINLINRLEFSTITEHADVKTLVDAFRLWLYFQRGIRTGNHGDHDIAAYLPALVERAGFCSIEAYTNDRAFVVLPSKCDPSVMSSTLEDVHVIRRRAIEGGASEIDVAAGLAAIESLQELKAKQVTARQYAQAGLSNMIVVGARKES